MIHEGLYHVYEFHPAVEGWDVHHAVEHADGVETVLVDQRTNEEQWNLLGTFRFTPDKPARVTITDDASGTEVAADAIRFELAGCGDGLVGDGETCDGANLGGETCESRGYEAGTLRCLPDCGGFDESGCEGPAPDDGGEEAGPDAASDTGLEDGPADAVGPDGGGGFTSGGCGCGMAR